MESVDGNDFAKAILERAENLVRQALNGNAQQEPIQAALAPTVSSPVLGLAKAPSPASTAHTQVTMPPRMNLTQARETVGSSISPISPGIRARQKFDAPPVAHAGQTIKSEGGTVLVWTSEEKAAYVRSLGLASMPGEWHLLRVLIDAFAGAPLPAPWVPCRGRRGVFFSNPVTGENTRTCPLEVALRELAMVCKACLNMPGPQRDTCIAALQERWDVDIDGDLKQWSTAKDSQGREYFWHRGTKEAIWQSPAEVLLPAHYMRMKATELLRDEVYMGRVYASWPPHSVPPPPQEALQPASERLEAQRAVLRRR